MRLKALHHARFEVPDLDRTEAFARDFGLITALRSESALYMRTGGGDAFAFAATLGETPRFVGFAVEVESEAGLQEAIDRHGAGPIHDLDSPGGGQAVSLTDPNGFSVDLVHGVARVTPDGAYAPLLHNAPTGSQRLGHSNLRRPAGPAKLFRLGHMGLFIRNLDESLPWYRAVLGLIPSDIYHLQGQPGAQIVAFCRLDHGEEPVDHHTIGLLQSQTGEAACHHISLEAQDYDAQFMSHLYLESKGYDLVWGVGRHPHGSHVFDVWRDPDRNRFETYSDTDLLRASDGTRTHDIADMKMDVWSNEPADRAFAP